MSDTFHPGQRWRSEAEPELGLGVVQVLDGKRVRLFFPAAEETRIYASAQAPLRRVAYQAGDELLDAEGAPFTVTAVREQDGALVYADGERDIPESEIQVTAGPSEVLDRLRTGQVDEDAWFELRREAHTLRHHLRTSPVRGFLGARVELIPHQLHIAHEVAGRERPRVLLADEVGLGKTIEACLVLHRLLCTGRAQRVLILVPGALVHQWFVELYRRFHLRFGLYGRTVDHFEDAQCVIADIDALVAEPAQAVEAVRAGWDLVIVDEAHHLAWEPGEPGLDYALVEALARDCHGLLLLTATPEQLGRESHFARLRLLDPDRYPDLDTFLAESERYRGVAQRAEALFADGDLDALRELLDHEGPGRALFRNTRAAVAGFPERVVHPAPVADRTGWLVALLRDNPDAKFLLICNRRDEVEALADTLRKRIQVKTAQFHEGLTLLQRDRNAAWFAEDDGARLLLCSEIGGEGRNFQFCHHLVLFDLPDHPERLEQRIGRLDRIGQAETIHIHVPYLEGTREERLFHWYHEGMNAFAAPLRGAWQIVTEFGSRFEANDPDIVATTRTARDRIESELEAGRDRLLELHSCDPQHAARLADAIRAEGSDSRLRDFLFRLFEHAGLLVEDLGQGDFLLQAGAAYTEVFPGLPRVDEGGWAVTFDRARALAREDIDFLTADHPVITAGIDHLLGSPRGSVSVVHAAGDPGIFLQAIFLLECPAPPRLHLDRFLAATPLAICIDHTGTETEPGPLEITRDADRYLLDDRPALAPLLPDLVETAETLAIERADKLATEAIAHLHVTLAAEIERLRRLAETNPDIHPRDLEALASERDKLEAAIGQRNLRLDALRLIIRS